MKLRRIVIALVVVGWSACSKQAVVDLTIDLDPGVDTSIVSTARSLQFDVSGAFTQSSTVALTQPFASNGQERIAIRAAGGGDVTLDVTALDALGTALLAGEARFTLRAGDTVAQELTLHVAPDLPDGGAPDDMAVADDMVVAGDMAATPVADLATADMAPSLCPTGVLLCDDFESGTISSTKWDNGTAQSNATVAIDNTRAHSGRYSLHLHTNVVNGGSATATIAETHTFTPSGATFWTRAFYYFPSNTSTLVANLFGATQNAAPNNDVALSIDHDALSIYNGFNSGSYVVSTTPKLPLDQWVCIEWEVYTGTPNQLHAWVNGQPVPALDLTQPTNPSPAIGIFTVGLGIYPPATSSTALDVWVDDVIFDHAPIGCVK
jgi:polysaccharide lyase-like protein